MLCKFITCLSFPFALIRWSSSHCHLMELFKSEESCKEKFDSNNNWKTAWPRMILECHLFLRLSLGFVWKMLNFVGKHLSFYPKYVSSFSVFFLKSKRVKPTSMSNKNKVCRKYVENKFSNSTSHKNQKKKERQREGERRAKTLSNFKNVSKTP